jgi:hypothetical protein
MDHQFMFIRVYIGRVGTMGTIEMQSGGRNDSDLILYGAQCIGCALKTGIIAAVADPL